MLYPFGDFYKSGYRYHRINGGSINKINQRMPVCISTSKRTGTRKHRDGYL